MPEGYKDIMTLARAGSTAFALSEFCRLGFDKIRHHEDIMSLHGRLYKDIYLSQSHKAAQEAARLSAEKYEAAFQDTKGFYSGINAATMSLLAGFDIGIIRMRADRILRLLPETRRLNAEAKYFTEATRAEGFLLLEERDKAEHALRIAIDHDPLNYIAHASTLKQFRMIAQHRGEPTDWLSAFTPPIAVHFAGHIFMDESSNNQESDLKNQITDAIQSRDIGFGFGSLAAGSDILIAETLLEEGGELHVMIPVAEDIFLQTSVAPFGEAWVKRYKDCRDKAVSFAVMSDVKDWPNTQLDYHTALACMGAAIRQGELLSVPSEQLLVLDDASSNSVTHHHAAVWTKSGRSRYVIPFTGRRVAFTENSSDRNFDLITRVFREDSNDAETFKNLEAAIESAIECRKKHPHIRQGLSFEIDNPASPPSNLAQRLCEKALPGSIYISQFAASYIALNCHQAYEADLMGKIASNEHMFSIREKG